MKPFPEDPTFTPGEMGFDDKDEHGRPYDLLGRKAVGQRLTDLLDRIEQPLVVALDGGWGSGKSHFLKLWTGAHKKELGGKAKVIYFDAFEHDYLDDPLISLIAALLKQSESEQEDKPFSKTALSKIKSTGMRLAKPGLRIGLAIATAGASEMANAVWIEGLQAAEGIASEAIDDFWKKETGRTAAMQQFRDALTALTAAAKEGNAPQKIVFIIDELDRCRPDYALTLLEIVKHFFAVPNVHFVLGTNLAALENSVRARYGEQINAFEYLLKFIRLRMTFGLSQVRGKADSWETYCIEILKRSVIDETLAESILSCLRVFASGRYLGLRDVERVVNRAQLLPPKPLRIHAAFSPIVASLIILEALAPAVYAGVRNVNSTYDEFKILMDSYFPINLRDPKTKPYATKLRELWLVATFPNPPSSASEGTRSALGNYDLESLPDFFQQLVSDLFDAFELLHPDLIYREP